MDAVQTFGLALPGSNAGSAVGLRGLSRLGLEFKSLGFKGFEFQVQDK